MEFYGLPGSGKSTTAKIVAEGLRQKGYDVKEPSAEIDGYAAFRRVMTKAVRAVVFYLTHPDILCEAKMLVHRNGYARFGVWPQMVNIAQKLLAYHGNVGPCVYVWDEGIVQAAISLSVGGTVVSSDNEQWFRTHIPNGPIVIKIYLETPLEIVGKRLENRNDGQSRVEREQDETKKAELLRKFETACEEIGEPCCHIKTNNRKPEEIASLVQKAIERMLLG